VLVANPLDPFHEIQVDDHRPVDAGEALLGQGGSASGGGLRRAD
jgi:hypothetical protein